MKALWLHNSSSTAPRSNAVQVQRITTMACAALSLLLPLQAMAQQPVGDDPKAPTSQNKPQKTELQQLQIADLENLAATKISIDVRNVGVGELVRTIGRTNPPKIIELRNPLPLTLSLSLKDVPLGRVLTVAAVLAGCDLYLLPDRFLIAPPEGVLKSERAVAEKYSLNASNRRTMRGYTFGQSLVQNLHEAGQENVKFSQLTETQRRMLQWMANAQSETTESVVGDLPQDAKITIEAAGNGAFNLKVDASSLQRKYMWLNIMPQTSPSNTTGEKR